MTTDHTTSPTRFGPGRPVTFEGARLYRVVMFVDGERYDESVVAADREGLATTRHMFLTDAPLHGQQVSYEVTEVTS